MIEFPSMRRFFDRDLVLSVEAPEDCERAKERPNHLAFVAPEEGGYSARITFELKNVEPPESEPDWFVNLIGQLYFQGGLGLENYELVEAFEIDLAGHAGFVARYEWVSDELGLHFSHADGLVITGAKSFLEIHGYSLKELESKYVPTFVYMMNSVRLGPEAAAGGETRHN